MGHTVRVSKECYDTILAHARACLPEEACGLIAGRIDGATKVVERVYLLTNADHSREHFSIDPQEQLAAVRDARSRGLALLGNWHSHPDTPARQSEEDKRLSYDHSASYLILSLVGTWDDRGDATGLGAGGADAEGKRAKGATGSSPAGKRRPVLKSFHFDGAQSTEEPLVIE